METRYSAKDIKVLEGLEAVRKRPAMYIGDTSFRGFHHLLWEVLDNSIDERLAGYTNKIKIILHEDGSAEVIDDGRGIPVDIHPTYKKSALEIVLTVLHAGGKFDTKAYKVSGGLHGVGISVVNALSEYLEVKVKRGGKIWYMKFQRGQKVEDLKVIGEAKDTGTSVRFKPDKEIFGNLEFDYKYIKARVKELAYLNKGLIIELEDKRTNKRESFKYEKGIEEYLEELTTYKNKILSSPIYFNGTHENSEIEVAFNYVLEDKSIIKGYVNNIYTIEGGTHITGFMQALNRLIKKYIEEMNIKVKHPIESEDIKEGLIAIISLKLPQPEFEGQTKTKLGSKEGRTIAYSLTLSKLEEYFDRNPSDIRKIIDRVIRAAEARIAAKRARELVKRKSALESFDLPGKLSDCSTKDKERAELFIVEGESAGGSAKLGRDREFQAVLPLKGKIINVEKNSMLKVLKNEEIKTLISAIGTGIGENFDMSKLRYGKIIIMTDADVDGAHIRTLLLTFFYRYLPKLIEEGKVYLALPPLYKIKDNKGNTYYVYTDKEKEEMIKRVEKEGNKVVEIQRYKGLGEMNPEQLWETTMDPKRRKLKKVDIEDAVEAEKTFTVLMGEKVEPRKKFILENAPTLKMEELDI